AGILGENGFLEEIVSRPAPPVTGKGRDWGSKAAEYRNAAEALLNNLLGNRHETVRLGITSQRSSFLLWEKKTGTPVTPLISWRDRSALAWCGRRRSIEASIRKATGLPLFPQYAGPKLAVLLRRQPKLRRGLERGTLLFGTLETYLIWCWSPDRAHETDLTMAARTVMADPKACTWLEDLLDTFNVPGRALPRIVDTGGRSLPLGGNRVLGASIADQASVAQLLLGDDSSRALVNAGSGAFILRSTGPEMQHQKGYLSGPIRWGPEGGGNVYALEGAINGAAITVDRFGAGPTELPSKDPVPEAFCLPDQAGIGSPYLLPARSLSFSKEVLSLADEEKRRIVLEGIVFRTRQNLEGLFPGSPPDQVFLSGGLSREPFLAPALAACLGRPVSLLEELEGTLLGVARLAADSDRRWKAPPAREIDPGPAGAYLAWKFRRWKAWVSRRLAASTQRKA
ncbi:MAG: FGGY family carbohydrate kinase, partial [Acidobacteria bacterium]|nr:FGGY family carbohydrate kinase [Acidobacteriota bacterium]